MSTGKSGKAAPRTVEVTPLEAQRGSLKALGGSNDDDFNNVLANQVIRCLWLANADQDERERQMQAAISAMFGVKPQDELEGMLAAQMVGVHSAAMECLRRAMIKDQTFEGWQAALSQANKLVRSYATLLEALNKHRGKGQQVVRVEHVTVQAGGQAIVGAVSQGGGDGGGSDERSHAKGAAALAHAPECPLRCPDPQGDPVPLARGER
jgi:hypothetical protein